MFIRYQNVVKLYKCEDQPVLHKYKWPNWCKWEAALGQVWGAPRPHTSGKKKSPSVQRRSGLSYRWEATGFTAGHPSSVADTELPKSQGLLTILHKLKQLSYLVKPVWQAEVMTFYFTMLFNSTCCCIKTDIDIQKSFAGAGLVLQSKYKCMQEMLLLKIWVATYVMMFQKLRLCKMMVLYPKLKFVNV